MSIIDKINSIEDRLQEIKHEGSEQIRVIFDKSKDKKVLMREHYQEEIAKESAELEQQMLDRVQKYSEYIKANNTNVKDSLAKAYKQKRELIINQICGDFWR